MRNDKMINIKTMPNGYNVYAKETKAPIFNEGYVEGFKASQQLNENKFTLEDIQDALRLGYDIGKDFEEDHCFKLIK